MQANADRVAAGSVALRKDIYSLTPDELAAYREAIQKVMERTDNKGYNFLAGIHGVPQFLCVHHRWDWLPWHRAYLYLFEQCLQDEVPGVTIPWWDWTSADTHTDGIPPAFAQVTTPDGQPNPLLEASIHVLNPQENWPTETHRSPQPPTHCCCQPVTMCSRASLSPSSTTIPPDFPRPSLVSTTTSITGSAER